MHSHNLNKATLNSILQLSVLHLGRTHDLLEPKCLRCSTSWTLPPTAHSAPFTDSDRLHSIATPSLVTFWPPFRDSDPAMWCQASAFLYNPFHPEVSTAAQGRTFNNGLSVLRLSCSLSYYPRSVWLGMGPPQTSLMEAVPKLKFFFLGDTRSC